MREDEAATRSVNQTTILGASKVLQERNRGKRREIWTERFIFCPCKWSISLDVNCGFKKRWQERLGDGAEMEAEKSSIRDETTQF